MTAVRPYTRSPFSPARVREVLTGGRPDLTPADRHEAIRRLTKRGMGKHAIAARLGCSIRTVDRAKKATA